ncbi:hypothetical protein [Streptomyces europaeiscabiei]|uniref:hypothetical protein n=1 Tax=Streptomyces europaeiscabiei TaxID=146819 RepID=UPI0029B25A91|nr:hypothetical protein [Streptomyces europaeiscabiei]MDX3636412.1 hypothetical protein [Streptomyces europaeiscabiei]MDX3654493.1 hypothetical protein [Streptomyces europaeiscabiei]
MRSARMLLVTAAASAVLTLGAPGVAYASGGWDTTDSSSSEEHGKDSHEAPRGDMPTGGGTPTTATDNGWSKQDSETTKGGEQGTAPGAAKQDTGPGATKQDENSWSGKQGGESWSGKQGGESWSGKPEKPSGGVHTGGGGLASPSVTAGGLAVLAVAATGLYAARRKKTAGSAA